MPIDLRSDTFTLPTTAMLDAVHTAELGDDVYREDPTVRRLEARAADLLGHEAGLFFPSATMANLCALLTHCARGQRVLCGSDSHVFCYETGGAAALGGLVYHTVPNTPDGGLDLIALARALPSPDDPHCAPAGVLTFENTQARRGGKVLDVARSRAMVELAHAHGVPVHLDGARLFNAAVALGVAVRDLVAGADTAQVCLSKGLAAPIGSLLTGTTAFIERARWARKQVGGGLRQVGVIAAMGLVALETMPPSLGDDHARARRLAQALHEHGGALEVQMPESNIVLLRHRTLDVDALIDAARARGVLLTTADDVWVRAVTHHGVGDSHIAEAIRLLQALA
jgi:threonine aldolase